MKNLTSNFLAKTGALVYLLWGLLHIVAAIKVFQLGETLEPSMVQARIFQNAWNLLFFALFGSVVAIFLNWKNSRLGYWLNLVVVSAGDIGFIIFVLEPGYIPYMPGLLGPLLWIVALNLTTLGLFVFNDKTTKSQE